MFFISEAHNLDSKPQATPLVNRLQHFDTVKDMIKLMNNNGRALSVLGSGGDTYLSN
jgi:hypothetical protein